MGPTLDGLDLEGVIALQVENGDLRARAEQAEKELDALVANVSVFLNREADSITNYPFELHENALRLRTFARRLSNDAARAQTLLAIVRAAEEETEAEDIYAAANLRELQHLRVALGEKTNARRAAVQAHKATHTSSSEDKPSQ